MKNGLKRKSCVKIQSVKLQEPSSVLIKQCISVQFRNLSFLHLLAFVSYLMDQPSAYEHEIKASCLMSIFPTYHKTQWSKILPR